MRSVVLLWAGGRIRHPVHRWEPRPPQRPARQAGRADGSKDHPALSLQRLVGNRATAVVLARKPPGPPIPVVPENELEDRPIAVALRTRGAQPYESSPVVLRLQALL